LGSQRLRVAGSGAIGVALEQQDEHSRDEGSRAVARNICTTLQPAPASSLLSAAR